MCFARTLSMAATGDGSIGLIINRDDSARLSQCNRDVSLRDGDACPILTDEPGAISGRGHLGLLFPREPLIERVRNIADVVALRIPRETEWLRLLVSYVNALPEKLTLSSPKLRRTVVEHIYDLAALAICPDRGADENSLSATAAARLELALEYIKKHFDRPALTITSVARDQSVSPRYLQRLIESTGSTFTENVNELRLQRAYTLLTSAGEGQERISDIALRAGFSDIAHFNRSFRRRFGDTPRAIRATATTVDRG
jgi:AraC-like DNA-binding protein